MASVSGLCYVSFGSSHRTCCFIDRLHFTFTPVAPPLTFSALSEAEQKKTVMAGCPIALQCELSDSTGEVSWYKDGTKLLPENGVDLQSEGNLRSLVVPAAEHAHTGVYRCESKDDDIQFAVEVKGDAQKLCSAFTVLHGRLTVTVTVDQVALTIKQKIATFLLFQKGQNNRLT